MSAPLILHIETATDICSVALSEGNTCLTWVDSGAERSHASLLNPFIRQVLSKADRRINQLEAVAVSKGPGSYTGLRIGVSTAKGIAYGLNLPLLSAGTLESLSQAALAHPKVDELISMSKRPVLLCPMLDARRMEAYTEFRTPNMEVLREVSADIIDENSYRDLLEEHEICFFGNGSDKCREALQHPHAHFIPAIEPSAQSMIEPVLQNFKAGNFENVAYFEPFYLKDFVATTPRKKGL